VVVHTSPGMQRSALYVACSRATSAAGLFIIGPFVPLRSAQDSASEEELRELRSAKFAYSIVRTFMSFSVVRKACTATIAMYVCSDQLMLVFTFVFR